MSKVKKTEKHPPSKKVRNETDYLLSTKANVKRLSDSINRDKLGKIVKMKVEQLK